MKAITVIIVIVFVLILIGASIYFEFNDKEYVVTIVKTERVNNKEDSKYLIFCETESGESIVFENTDSFLRGKFNSSDIYGSLQIGKKYKVTAVGIRIPFLSAYKNIISFEELEEN